MHQDQDSQQMLSAGQRPLRTAEDALAYITAGQARFTLRSRKTGMRYTYRARRTPDSPELNPTFFVDLLKGPANAEDFAYVGLLTERGFSVTKKTRHLADSSYVAALKYMMRGLLDLRRIPTDLEIWHSSKCGRCGRDLTVPESIATGLGPKCASIVGKAQRALELG